MNSQCSHPSFGETMTMTSAVESKTRIGIYKMLLVAVRTVGKSSISLTRADLIHLRAVS